MERIEKLEAEFQRLIARGAVYQNLAFTKAGIALGAGSVIVPLRTSAGGRETHDLSREERILALLSAAFGQRIDPAILDKLQHASEIFARGDPCLASIYLTQLPLSRLDQEHQAWSLFLADRLIECGYAPRDLVKALGFELPQGLRKFDADQPRDDHGRWTSGGGSGAAGGDGSAAPVVEGGSVSSRKPGQTANIVASNEKDKEYEEERRQGTESPKDDIEHARPIPLPQLPPFEPEYPLPRAKFGDEVNIPGLPEDIKGTDITKPKARMRNYESNLTQSEFESKLEALGWTKTPRENGKVMSYSKSGSRYDVRSFSKSTGGPTADFHDSRSIDDKPSMKLRLRGDK